MRKKKTSKNRLNKTDYGNPVVFNRAVASVWRVRVPEDIWDCLKDADGLSTQQAIRLANLVSGQYPREWRYHSIDNQNNLLIVRQCAYEPKRLRKDLSDGGVV